MKKDDVQIGRAYTAKVTDKLVSVRIESENRHGGWDATNLATGKTVRIKSPQRLRAQRKTGGAKPAEAATRSPTVVAGGKKDATPTKAPKSPTAARGAKKAATGTTRATGPKAATRAKRGEPKAKRPSGLDAAARVLAESAEPMGVRQIVEVAFEKGYWKSDGKTPHATVYSAIIREIGTKGKDARFKKVDRGRFAVNK